MRGENGVEEDLKNLTEKGIWNQIQEDISSESDDYKQEVREWLNKFGEDNGDESELGDYLFDKDPTSFGLALSNITEYQALWDALEQIGIIPSET